MDFTAEHISQTQVIHLDAPPSRVFPLFEPVGEKAWAIGWEPAFLYPASGEATTGAVFTTQHPDGGTTIWTITTYDPANLQLTYLRITPGSRVGVVEIRCEGALDGTTNASVTYTFTALSEQGNNYIASFTTNHYQQFMADWEQAINHYLRSGRPLPHH